MSIYKEKGYENRRAYLFSVADEYSLEVEIVLDLAYFLGESEDFDGLINHLDDFCRLDKLNAIKRSG